MLWWLSGLLAGCGLGWSVGYWRGHRHGAALCPSDYVLRDVARQRDQFQRERDALQRRASEVESYAEHLRCLHAHLDAEVLAYSALRSYGRVRDTKPS
jgi:hypothetical protein